MTMAAASRRLSDSGKAKLRHFVADATNLEDLAEVEAALDQGLLSERLAARLKLGDADFEAPAAAAPAALPASQPLPLGALGLTDLGLAKARKAIEHATDFKVLAVLDRALKQGDIPRLRQMLDLQPEDLRGEEEDEEDDASTGSTEELEEANDDDDDEYDPFATEPAIGPAAGSGGAAAAAREPAGRAKEEADADVQMKAEELEDAKAALEEVRAQATLEEAIAVLEEAKAVIAPEGSEEPVRGEGTADTPKAEAEDAGSEALAMLEEARALLAPERLLEKGQEGKAEAEEAEDRRTEEAEGEASKKLQEATKTLQEPKAPKAPRPAPLAALSAYADSDSEEEEAPAAEAAAAAAAAAEPPAKRARGAGGDRPAAARPRALPWPVGWAWLVSRTQRHPDFRAPTLAAGASWAQAQSGEPPPSTAEEVPAVALATSRVYVGDPTHGYDAHHLARVVAVELSGEVLLDVLVRPGPPVLDCRTHFTGITRDALAGASAVDLEAARQRLLALLTPETLLLGYRLASDLEALRLWHGPWVDVSLLFQVDSRKQHQYHPLRYIAKRVLGEEIDERDPHDAVESARLVMRLARHEAALPAPTPAFGPSEDSGLELLVRHIPSAWGDRAAPRVAAQCRGAAQGFEVRWLLSEADPTEWRGEATLVFPSTAARDHCFDSLRSMTDVHVQWDDLPGAPALGTFITEQALMKAFSSFGVVVSARLPRKPTTREPQHFAFVSFLEREDAQRAARGPRVEVQLTPTWQLPLRPRLARFGNADDKRIAVPARSASAAEFGSLDWLHVSKR